jgi:hypothetical protein
MWILFVLAVHKNGRERQILALIFLSLQMSRDLSVTMHEDMHPFVVTHHFVQLQRWR